MGHSDIETTMRYAGYLSSHAVTSIREAKKLRKPKLHRRQAEVTFSMSDAKVLDPLCAPVAQLDRAADFESVGRGFESLRACHFMGVCGKEPNTPSPCHPFVTRSF